MRRILLLAVVTLALVGCVSRRPPPTDIIYLNRAQPDSDNSHWWHPLAFKVGKQRFGTLQDFKAFIAALPSGTVVRWNSGCIRYEVIPLAHSEMSIRDFKAYCKQYGVEFDYDCGGI